MLIAMSAVESAGIVALPRTGDKTYDDRFQRQNPLRSALAIMLSSARVKAVHKRFNASHLNTAQRKLTRTIIQECLDGPTIQSW